MAAVECSRLDRERLKALYCSSDTARAVFDYLRSREPGANETTLDGLTAGLSENGEAISRSDVLELFRELEGLGFGKFIVGRRGRDSRFRWAVDPVDLAAIAAEDGRPRETVRAGKGTVDASGEGTITHRYVLRPGFVVDLTLPGDLSGAEASRLADFIRTLPFD